MTAVAQLHEKVPGLLEQHRLSAQRITPLEAGWINPAFCADNQYVVRFNVRDPGIKKFKRESLALSLLQPLSVPTANHWILTEVAVPQPAEVLITEKLPGASVSSYWSDLNEEQRWEVCLEAATHLIQIHSVDLKSFGCLEPGPKKYERWTDYLAGAVEEHWKAGVELEVFASEVERKLWQALRNIEPLLNEVKTPRLIHGDFHLANVIGQSTRVTGVIDFEWAAAADPALDFRSVSGQRSCAPGSEILIRRAYEQIGGPAQIHEAKLGFYRALVLLETANCSAKYWLRQSSWGDRNHSEIISRFFANLDLALNF